MCRYTIDIFVQSIADKSLFAISSPGCKYPQMLPLLLLGQPRLPILREVAALLIGSRANDEIKRK